MDLITSCLLGVSAIIILGYIFLTWNHDYWKKRGIPFDKPKLIFGCMYESIMGYRNIAYSIDDIYWKFPKSPLVGTFSFLTPTLLIRDPEMIKDVLVKSFSSFHDNDMPEDSDPVFKYNPFILRGERWKKTRTRLSPAFSSGKIKLLMPNMIKVSNDLVDYISKHSSDSFDAKELSAKYTTDVVALSVCGINGNSFVHEDPEFRRNGREIFGNASWSLILFFFAPKIAKLLRFKLIPKHVEVFFKKLIKESIDYRASNSIQRKDFLQLMMSLEENNEDFQEDELLSHVISFLTDGIETSAGALAFTIYLLAVNPEKQALAQEEVDKIWEKHGEFVPDAFSELHYVENCILEAMRLYPPGSLLRKLCTKKHEFTLNDGSRLIAEPNTTIFIPVQSLHLDPNYFTDPLSYIPERHEEEAKSEIYRQTYLTFGQGPRICIGSRFAMTQLKIGLAHMLRHYKIVPVKETPKKIVLDPKQLISTSKDTLYVGFQKRQFK